MKHLFYLRLLLILVIGLGTFVTTTAQEATPPEEAVESPHAQGRPGRPQLLRELGLSPEQVRQIRLLNRERRPNMEAAARRLREANRALDMAIYSDTVSDADFEGRLKEFQSAQAEMARLRFTNELAVRKILTSEQLTRFRELRRRFAERRMMESISPDEPAQRRHRRFARPPVQDQPFF